LRGWICHLPDARRNGVGGQGFVGDRFDYLGSPRSSDPESFRIWGRNQFLAGAGAVIGMAIVFCFLMVEVVQNLDQFVPRSVERSESIRIVCGTAA
jgi:hypothetical protein